jgi:uncharacterized metal-binding protein YceD (DUF177 family)
LKEYLISYKSLEYGEYTYNYNIRDAFFEKFDNTDVKGANLKASILLNKKNTHIEIYFDIKGTIALICSRCLEPLDYKINIEQTIYIKFGEEDISEDENLYILSDAQNEINLSEFINEFIVVAVPIRSVHPEDKNGEPTCPSNMLKYINNIKNEGSQVDPRWNELNKLKDGTS